MSEIIRPSHVLITIFIIGCSCLFVFMFAVVVNHSEREVHKAVPEQVCNLPCKCKHLLNLGTTEWMDCMGVGYK